MTNTELIQVNNKYEQMRIPQLENIHRGITRKKEDLQKKLQQDMEIKTCCYDILPKNYELLPVQKCSLHDLKQLEELHEEAFDVFWTMEKKKAIENDNLEYYYAEHKFYSFIDSINDEEKISAWHKIEVYCGRGIMSSHDIIYCILEAPNFLEEVLS